jgi:hypothetical protein
MKFRHKSNFVPLEVDQIILDLIGDYYSPVDLRQLSKLLASILLKKDVELILEEFGYVKFE